jgi:ABC-2 type transport system permease protein
MSRLAINPALIAALMRKELIDVRRNRTALLPGVIVTLIGLGVPLLIAVIVPAYTGESLGEERDLVRASAIAGRDVALSPGGQVQLFLFQQFLMLLLLTPITGAMSLAAHSVVGEKLARTLEPLLATPISTLDLLLAKVLGAFLPSLSIALAGLIVYAGGVAVFAEPGVLRAMLGLRSLLLVVLLMPATALLSLQTAIVVSSRVSDPRTAQQFGVLIVLPLTGIVVAQFRGDLWLSPAALAAAGGLMLAAWVGLLLFSARLFERETILTRWR